MNYRLLFQVSALTVVMLALACETPSAIPENKGGQRPIEYPPADTIIAPKDTVAPPKDTIVTPKDTVTPPKDTIVPPEPLVITDSATILPLNPFGRVTDKFLYDVKQGNNTPISDSNANMFFGQFGMNGIRIPIYGNGTNGGHTAPGVIGDGTYDKILTAIASAKANYRGNGHFYIFASKKLDGKASFPSWVKDANGILPGPYSTMLCDYLRFMKDHGVEVDVLGIDNESNFHEGNITAARFTATIDSLKPKLTKAGLKIPLFIGHERYNPERASSSWIQQLYDSGKQDRLDIYGTHYYPHHHVKDFHNALVKEWNKANSDHSRQFWATEPHWDNDDEAKSDMLLHSEKAMGAMFDQTDLGLDAFCWWSFKYEGDMRACMMKELSLAIYGSRPIRVNDHDGADIITPGTFVTRAFIRGNEVNLFVQNIVAKGTTGRSYPAYEFKMSGRSIKSATALQWTDDTPYSGRGVNFKRIAEDNVVLEIPSRSVTKICFILTE